MNGNELALRPLRHFADFSGRSSRGELLYFALLLAVLGIPAAAVDLVFGTFSSKWAVAAIPVLFLCPVLAMCVRRLHDVGRSGWWLLFAFPAVVIGGWKQIQQLLHPFVYPPAGLVPHFVELLATCLGLAVAILLLWDEDPATNRYGPNPRHGPAGEPA